MRRTRLVVFALLIAISACSRRKSPLVLSVAPSTNPAAPGSAPAQDDGLTAELHSPDDMVRYRAAARAYEELDSSKLSVEARAALFDIVANAKEREGVRLWAARAIAKHDPERALKRFVELNAAGVVVDSDAWILLGPSALPALSSQCTPADCPGVTFAVLTIIVGNAPSHEASRQAIPLLLREATRSEQRKALAYRALGAFGSNLVPELELLRNHDDPALQKAATEALAAVRENP